MIANEARYRSTKAHLDRFDEAVRNLKARSVEHTKLEKLELEAVQSMADDLRAELFDFDSC